MDVLQGSKKHENLSSFVKFRGEIICDLNF